MLLIFLFVKRHFLLLNEIVLTTKPIGNLNWNISSLENINKQTSAKRSCIVMDIFCNLIHSIYRMRDYKNTNHSMHYWTENNEMLSFSFQFFELGGGCSGGHHSLESSSVFVSNVENSFVGQRSQSWHDHRFHWRILRRTIGCGEVTIKWITFI